jgi:hypothetical protein
MGSHTWSIHVPLTFTPRRPFTHTTVTIVTRSLVSPVIIIIIIIVTDFYPPNNTLRNHIQSGRRYEGQANPDPPEMDPQSKQSRKKWVRNKNSHSVPWVLITVYSTPMSLATGEVTSACANML